jgi:hypothetical protein
VRDDDRRPDGQRARQRLEIARDQLEEGALAAAVGSDDADDSAAGQVEADILEEQPVAEAHGELLGLDDEVAEPRAGRDLDTQVILARRDLLTRQLLVPRETRLALGAASGRVGAHPLQLVLEQLAAALVLARLAQQCLLLLLQPALVVALVGIGAA